MISKWGLSVLGVLSLMLGACDELSGEQQVASRTEQAQDWMKRLSEKAASADLIQNDAPRVTGEEVKLRVAALPQALLARMSYHTEGNQSFLQVLDNLSVLLNIPLNAHELGVMPLLASAVSAAVSLPDETASTGMSASPRVFDQLTSDCWGSMSRTNTRSPASRAVTASEEAMVLFPDPPFCVTNAIVRISLPFLERLSPPQCLAKPMLLEKA